MRAILRFCAVLAVAGLVLAPTVALAQSVPDATTNAPAASGAVGPPELRNFSLPGTVTRPGDQTAPPAAARQPPASSETRTSASPTNIPARQPAVRTERSPGAQLARNAPAPVKRETAEPAPQAAPAEPSVLQAPSAPAASVAAPPSQPASAAAHTTPAPAPAPSQFPIIPWLAAAFALLVGGAFLLFMRRRRREAYAGPEFDLFVAPESALAPPQAPAPLPRAAPPAAAPPAPAPPRPAALGSGGIVSSRLRPSLEIAVQPLRCHSDADTVVIEFELELLNVGTVPARAVLAEASLLNAGAAQDEQLAAFFARPAAQGEPVDSIPPLKSMKFTSQVVAPRSAIQEYELAGRKAFVPVIAFNTLYRWSGGQAQTSAAYLVGRETGGDKLGPLRLDGGDKEVRGLGSRPLPAGLKT
jgi:hypothetical protein